MADLWAKKRPNRGQSHTGSCLVVCYNLNPRSLGSSKLTFVPSSLLAYYATRQFCETYLPASRPASFKWQLGPL